MAKQVDHINNEKRRQRRARIVPRMRQCRAGQMSSELLWQRGASPGSGGEGFGDGSGSEAGSGHAEAAVLAAAAAAVAAGGTAQEPLIALSCLVEPLKEENARLAQCLRQLRGMLQDVVAALRGFFADPDRREWFREQKEDAELVRFFQRLISWYRKVAENDKDPMLAFYRRIWEYERGSADPDASEKSGRPPSPTASHREPKNSREPWMTSARLYDGCLARAQSMELTRENDRLREQNSGLHERLSVLERELQQGRRGELPLLGEGAPRLPGEPGSRLLARPVRTLQELVAEDARWQRLVEDPDGLFTLTDVIDESYEQYLGDILELMDRDKRPFREAIQLSAAASVVGLGTEGGGRGGDAGRVAATSAEGGGEVAATAPAAAASAAAGVDGGPARSLPQVDGRDRLQLIDLS